MPIYEYACEGCGREFEVFVRTAGQKVHCPDCRSPRARKRFSVFGAQAGSKAGPCPEFRGGG